MTSLARSWYAATIARLGYTDQRIAAVSDGLVIIADRSGADRIAIDAHLDPCLTGSAMIPDPAP